MSTLHPHTILFARGTLARLALWPALRLAVHASWGGPASASKQRWLAGVLVDQFEPFIISTSTSSSDTATSASASAPFLPTPTPTSTSTSTSTPPPDELYVEELLLQVMADEFDVVLEDDSAAAVARDMLRLFGAIRAGDEAFVLALEAQAEKVKGHVPQHEMGVGSGSESDSGSGSEWEDEDEGEKESEEPVPRLLNRTASRAREEPQVDQDGFTMVKRKAHR